MIDRQSRKVSDRPRVDHGFFSSPVFSLTCGTVMRNPVIRGAWPLEHRRIHYG